ncbi:MAG: hypothetical protein ACR2PX_00690 [Endozoicomonas sp.]|uniref:hypothetical protein n=1 Tax=Endozoicomonas sp. TaxID=1892382 RepID=UPI003D9B6B78
MPGWKVFDLEEELEYFRKFVAREFTVQRIITVGPCIFGLDKDIGPDPVEVDRADYSVSDGAYCLISVKLKSFDGVLEKMRQYLDRYQVGHHEPGIGKATRLKTYDTDKVLKIEFSESRDKKPAIFQLDFRPILEREEKGTVFYGLLENDDWFNQVEGNYCLKWPDPETGLYDQVGAIDWAPESVRWLCERYGVPVDGDGLTLSA